MTSFSDDELFTPTLKEADDAVGFDRPWNPWSLVVLTFFFGLTAGGGLLAFNSKRLGMKKHFYPVLVLVVLVEVILLSGNIWMIATGMVDPHQRDETQSARLGVRLLSCLTAILIAYTQQKRYRLFQASHLPPGALFWPAFVASVISLKVHLIVNILSLPLFS